VKENKDLNNTSMFIRKTEDACLALVESTSDSMYLVDVNCRYLFINSQHLSRLGIPTSDIIGRSYGEFHSPEETEIFAEKVKQVFATGKSVQHEHRSGRDNSCFLRTFSPVKEPGPDGKIISLAVVSKNITERKRAEEERERLIIELRDALSTIRTLRGMLPICSSCKKIRNDDGYWEQIDVYIRDHSEAEFSHGICPECAKKLYPQYYKEK
jgi:PAS domain S-box-containing protein